jgi:hypothetical protein
METFLKENNLKIIPESLKLHYYHFIIIGEIPYSEDDL